MTEKMKEFMEAVSKNNELQEKLKNVTDKAEIISIAKGFEFELTEADFEAPEGELSESELSGLSGGAYCFCAGGGGGTEGGNDGVCACVAYGQGNIVDNPTNSGPNELLYGYGGKIRCYCVLMGSGYEAEEIPNSDSSSFVF